ncbi:hypothetical protein [Marinomonas spartinae]|uniref:hypothetical protein n=1 Tax=Marinomonas spartinae TaxID=1792290 RepID=UPI0018F2144A|nr:hypothetical protein [Marinomonas spartinae]MBJ7554954.1 hypothetical protein [Marinomonas spartinae]
MSRNEHDLAHYQLIRISSDIKALGTLSKCTVESTEDSQESLAVELQEPTQKAPLYEGLFYLL